MTFSYDPGALTTSRNKVRRLLGDVNSTSYEYEDEELDFLVGEETTIYGAASLACEGLAAKYASQVTKSVGDLKADFSDKAKRYSELATRFRSIAASHATVGVFAGGISKAAKDTEEADTDRVEPWFSRDMDVIPGSIEEST